MADELLSDDATWQRVWERVLDPVERHDIAMAVIRRRMPPEAFASRIAIELARRWRRRAVTLAIVYALWTVFWGMLAWDHLRRAPADPSLLTVGCTVAGVLAIAGCVAFRRRIRPVAAARPDARPARRPS